MQTIRIQYKPSQKRGALLRETLNVMQYRVSGSALIYMLEKSGRTEIVPLSEIEKIQVLKDDQEKGNGGG